MYLLTESGFVLYSFICPESKLSGVQKNSLEEKSAAPMNELHFFHFDEAFLTVAFPAHFFKFGFRLVLYDQSMNRTAAGKQQTKKGA